MAEKNNPVLVTGGTGLLGSHLLYKLVSMGETPRALFRNEFRKKFALKVFGYYSESPEKIFDSIQWIQADLYNYENVETAIHEADQVYHCAADVSFDPERKEEIISNNILITSNIVDCCIKKSVSKLCHVSSVAAVGNTVKGAVINEYTGWDESGWHSAYAVSKRRSEELVFEGIRKGLCAVIVNPSIIFGPGDWEHGSSAFFSEIKKGMAFYTKGVTGYVDVRDVAGSMISLMKSEYSGRRYIVSSENLSFHDVFASIAENLNVRRPSVYAPEALSWPVLGLVKMVSAVTGRKSPVTAENLRSAYSYQYYDNSEIIRDTGIKFIPVKQSIKDTCTIYLNEMSKRDPVIQ